MPFAILQGVDLPVDLPICQASVLIVGILKLSCQASVLTVGICKKLPFAILQGVDLPVDLPLDLPGISSQSRNLYEIAICHFMGVDLPVDLPLDLPRYQFSQ